jgi:hypothetical protein
MADYIGYILQGLFTGMGVYIGNYFGDRHIKRKLESIEARIKRVI